MQTPDCPLTENYNQNENLVKNEQQNNQQNIDINQFFVQGNICTEKKKYTVTFYHCRILVLVFVFILLFVSFLPITIPVIDLYIKLIFLISGVIISLLLLIFSNTLFPRLIRT